MEILVPVKVELFIEKKYFRQAEDTELKVENHHQQIGGFVDGYRVSKKWDSQRKGQ